MPAEGLDENAAVSGRGDGSKVLPKQVYQELKSACGSDDPLVLADYMKANWSLKKQLLISFKATPLDWLAVLAKGPTPAGMGGIIGVNIVVDKVGCE